MAAAKETAEEQLLRMIEGPSGPSPSRSPLRRFSVSRLLEQLRGWADALWHASPFAQPTQEHADVLLWRLRALERVFWIILIGLGVYLAVDFFVFQPQLPSPARRTLPSGSAAGTTAGPEDQLKPMAEYREALASRNPFGIATHGTEGLLVAPKEAKSRLEQLIGVLTIVGINRGRTPEALIEDTSAKRNFFVKVGDQVNGLTVKSIDEHGVMVTYEGEETLLK